jgi:ubiquinol-cytochrome c reductase cytochrome c1 subunit
MAFDVSNFIQYQQRRSGYRKPDKTVRYYMILTALALVYPFGYFRTRAHYRNFLSTRWEMYAVRDGVYYNHFKKGMKNSRAT